MKLFVLRFLAFISALIGLFILVWCINWFYLNKSNILAIDENYNTIVLGDSYTKYSINDSLLARTLNLSNNADSYFYSYLKLQHLKKINPQIKRLILGCSAHNLDISIENRWLNNPAYQKSRSPIYFPLMNYKDWFFHLTNDAESFLANSFSQFYSLYYYFKIGRNNFGGYSPLKHNVLKIQLDSLKAHKNANNELKMARSEIHFLEKINLFCLENNIELILLSTPVHKRFCCSSDISSLLPNSLSNLQYFNFSTLDLPDKSFGDMEHLNSLGAEIFTNTLINQKILQ